MTNLLLNAGLETIGDPNVFTSWDQDTAGTYTFDETSDPYAGSHAAKLVAHANGDYAWMNQNVTVEADDTFKVSFWAKGDGTNITVEIYRKNGGDFEDTPVLTMEKTTVATWTSYEATFPMNYPTWDNFRIEVRTSGVADSIVYIDALAVDTSATMDWGGPAGGDFEGLSDMGGPVGWNFYVADDSAEIQDGTTKHGGNYAVRLFSDADTVFGGVSSVSDILLTPLEEYTLSFWVRGDGSQSISYAVEGDVEGNIIFPTDTEVVGTEWTQVSADFIFGETDTMLTVSFETPGVVSGSAWVDDVSIVVKVSGSSPIEGAFDKSLAAFVLSGAGTVSGAGANELILNGGFETAGAGDPDFWANWSEVPGADGAVDDETSLVHAGSHAAKVTHGASSGTWISPTVAITVEAETEYMFSFWTRGDGTNAGRVTLSDNVSGIRIIDKASTGISGSSFTQVFMPFTTPAGCTEVVFGLMPANVEGAIAYFDDVSLQKSDVVPDLVDNFNFETVSATDDFALWTEVGAGTLLFDETTEIHGGLHAVKAVCLSGSAGWVEKVYADDGPGLYKLTVWMKGEAGTYGNIGMKDQSDAVFASAAVATTTSWVQQTLYGLLTPDRTELNIYLSADAGYGEGNVYFDDVAISKVTDFVLDQVFNPGFENQFSGFAGWTATAADGFDEETIVHSGAHAVRLGWTDTGDWAATEQTALAYIWIAPGNYTLTFWARGDGTVGGNYLLEQMDDTLIAQGDTNFSGSSWGKVTVAFTVAAGQSEIKLTVACDTGVVGFCYFDDFLIDSVSAPSTNKLLNGDFEDLDADHTPSHWQGSGAGVSSFSEKDITNAPAKGIKLVKSGSAPGYMYQDIFVDPGLYTFRIWARGDSINAGHYKFYGVSAAGVETLLKEGDTTASLTWTRVQTTINYPSGYDRLRLYLYSPLNPA